MTRNVSIFLIVLVLFLFGYVSSSYKCVIYNNSGQMIDKLVIQSKWKNKIILKVKDQQVIHLSIFAPYQRQVRVSVENPNQVRSTTFELQQPFSREKYNQVEIGFGAELKAGELGR